MYEDLCPNPSLDIRSQTGSFPSQSGSPSQPTAHKPKHQPQLFPRNIALCSNIAAPLLPTKVTTAHILLEPEAQSLKRTHSATTIGSSSSSQRVCSAAHVFSATAHPRSRPSSEIQCALKSRCMRIHSTALFCSEGSHDRTKPWYDRERRSVGKLLNGLACLLG